ncbi:MAG: DUF4178 domain-containing protein [Deltaproteobacteria bacterium]|nr:DUF4178 domain-containing protein [Deltaproteobacteria bacterium]
MISALIAGGFITLTTHLWRRSQAAQDARRPALLASAELERTLDTLEVGDILIYERRDLIVTEVWQLEAEAHSWREYRLDDEGVTRWLVADRRDGDGVRLGDPLDSALPALPSGAFDHQGEIFQLEANGQVDALLDGSPRGEVAYWDYAHLGRRLWIRRGGTLSFACVGERARRHLIDVLPGS